MPRDTGTPFSEPLIRALLLAPRRAIEGSVLRGAPLHEREEVLRREPRGDVAAFEDRFGELSSHYPCALGGS